MASPDALDLQQVIIAARAMIDLSRDLSALPLIEARALEQQIRELDIELATPFTAADDLANARAPYSNRTANFTSTSADQ